MKGALYSDIFLSNEEWHQLQSIRCLAREIRFDHGPPPTSQSVRITVHAIALRRIAILKVIEVRPSQYLKNTFTVLALLRPEDVES